MTIPAFAQGVNLIATTAGAFPWYCHRDNLVEVPNPTWIDQPDPDVPTSIIWGLVARDLVLRPYSWMLVTERYAPEPGQQYGWPKHMRHVPADTISVTGDITVVDGAVVPARDVLRFDSPWCPGALWNGRRILTTALLIEEATRRYSRVDQPAGVLKQTGGPDLLDGEIDELLTDWDAARQTRTTGFLSTTLDYQTTAFDPEKLQLTQAREENARDIARLLNLPPSMVNAETGSSLTYSTVEGQQQHLLTTTELPLLTSMADRFSMPDLTPRGLRLSPRLGTWLRADVQARFTAWATAIQAGFLTVDEVRIIERLPPLGQPVDRMGLP